MDNRWELDTRLVHAGERIPPQAGYPTVHDIVVSNSFVPESPEAADAILGGQRQGYTYSRHNNPTVDALAEAVRQLEGGEFATAYGSGMAAIHAALWATKPRPGDAIVVSRDLYGASINLVQEFFAPLGLRVVQADLVDLDQARRVLETVRPKAVLFEILSNPLLRVIDGPAITELAHAAGAEVIVDNTFTTPLLVRPFEFGADMVVHSATKYLSGHGDAMGGVLLAQGRYAEVIHRQQKLLGAVLGPFEAWLIHRGLKTLGLRFPRQCDNAATLAVRLLESGRFRRVHYPLLPDHPERERIARLMAHGRGGAVVTLELPGGRDAVFEFLRRLQLVVPATTVGDVYTLALYPVMASHRSQTREERAAMGITEGTVRIAVGIEAVEDIFADLIAAAEAAAAHA
ncbi:MAG: PLP-dependent aspartate aminotransferase family protein [Firmicutes bacterium]|nr:PLP-dependent transferase [Alicyclobacillaceae bacterium]MCL6498086.1 PLP-dependent aspartate aminotransferase family protein [Bacillota bacterium]